MFSKVLKSEAKDPAAKVPPKKKPTKAWAPGNNAEMAEMAEKAKKRDPGSLSSALGL